MKIEEKIDNRLRDLNDAILLAERGVVTLSSIIKIRYFKEIEILNNLKK